MSLHMLMYSIKKKIFTHTEKEKLELLLNQVIINGAWEN